MSPSLRNIVLEMYTDLGTHVSKTKVENCSVLDHLPGQGVLLVNAALTVELSSANSQYAMWQEFTKEMFTAINTKDHIVWVLWGNFAQRFEPLITNPTHEIIKGVHPSPLSAKRGFFGSKPFSKVNEYLKKTRKIKNSMVDQWIKNNVVEISSALENLRLEEVEEVGVNSLGRRLITEAFLCGYISALKNTMTIEDMDKFERELGKTPNYDKYNEIKLNAGDRNFNLF